MKKTTKLMQVMENKLFFFQTNVLLFKWEYFLILGVCIIVFQMPRAGRVAPKMPSIPQIFVIKKWLNSAVKKDCTFHDQKFYIKKWLNSALKKLYIFHDQKVYWMPSRPQIFMIKKWLDSTVKKILQISRPTILQRNCKLGADNQQEHSC